MIESARDVWDESRRATIIHQILSGELSLEAACHVHGLSADTVRSWAPAYRHRTQQALDEKLQQTSLVTSVTAERLGSAVYTGSLDDIAIPDLLQTCQMGSKNAVISITRGNERSTIWCERGEIVDAESGAQRGEPAVYRILNFEHGQVSADFRLEPRTRTVELPCHVLLIEGARHRDECARLLPQLKGPRSIFVQAPGAWAAPTTLMDREVLSLCDGERSVSDVLAASNLSDLDTLTTLVSLVGREYLLIDGTSTLPSPTASPVTAAEDKCSDIYLPLAATAPAVARSTRGAALLVALGLLLGISIWLGVEALRGQAPFRTAAVAGTSFAVEVSTDPPHAQLWLDNLYIGEGQVRRELPRDGKLHQLVVLAPDHTPTTLVFADSATRFHVVLEKLSSSPPTMKVSSSTTGATLQYVSAEASR